jgi:hypothetical protein
MSEAREELHAAVEAINLCVATLRPHLGLIERYRRERELMDSVGPIFNPTLFMSRERREVDALVWPILDKANELVRLFDALSGEWLARAPQEPPP